MEIKISKNAGFCFGVKKAVETVDNLLKNNKKVTTLGPIIHNSQIIERFKRHGVKVIDNVEKCDKDTTLVIRSHGIAKSTMDDIISKKINFIDATCPFVKKIHKIVGNEDNKYKITLIAGNKNHPEVLGIIGNCCSKYYTFLNSDKLISIINSGKISKDANIIVVAQTTFDISEWNKSLNILKNNYTNLQIFDTICNTTTNRQIEAANLAKVCDVMIVIGGKNSSNTIKLKDICEKYCKTYHIETKNDLPIKNIINANYVGITAGASTPVNIIEEVKYIMSDTIKNPESSSTFEQMLEESLNKMSTEKIVKGTVVKILPNEVFVDIGRKQSGFIPLSELTDDTSKKTEDIVKLGDEIDALILKTNDQDGTIMLSKKKIDIMKNWQDISNSKEKILSGKVINIVKGGLVVLSKGIKIFIPASLATLNKNESLEELKNKVVEFRIIEVDNKRKRAVGSIKSVLNDKIKEKREKFWNSVKVGDKMKGIVKSFTPYGAFVDIGGIDGMIYIADISWEKIKHPSDVLEIGQEISVVVKDLDKEKNRISLGYKEQFENPWDTFIKKFEVGSEIEVEIISMTDFGAFAKILPGVDGLIHISQISNKRINKPSDALKIGEKVKVKVINIDKEKHRVGLSIKELIEE